MESQAGAGKIGVRVVHGDWGRLRSHSPKVMPFQQVSKIIC